MSLSSRARTTLLGTLGLTIVGTIAATAWLLKPTWEAYRERVAFEQAARKARFDDEESMQQLAKLARQSGLPSFAQTSAEADRAVLTPFYLRSYWYCVFRPAPAANAGMPTAMTQIYRLEIPLEDYAPQTDNARKLISRIGQSEVRNTPSGPVEEPALPLEGEEARRVAFMWDFYEIISGRAERLKLSFEMMTSDALPR